MLIAQPMPMTISPFAASESMDFSGQPILLSKAMVIFDPNQFIDPDFVSVVAPIDAEKDRLPAATSSPSLTALNTPTPSSVKVVPSASVTISASILTSVMNTPVVHSSMASGVPLVNQLSLGSGISHPFVVAAAGTKAANFLASAIIGPIRHPSYPANQFPPPVHQLFFPLPSLHPKDLLLSRHLLPHSEPSQFKSWPQVPDCWIEWMDRLEPHFGRQ